MILFVGFFFFFSICYRSFVLWLLFLSFSSTLLRAINSISRVFFRLLPILLLSCLHLFLLLFSSFLYCQDLLNHSYFAKKVKLNNNDRPRISSSSIVYIIVLPMNESLCISPSYYDLICFLMIETTPKFFISTSSAS